MLEAVPARVVGGVAQSEVRPEIDDGRASRGQLWDEFGCRAVRQGEEDRVDRRQGRVHLEAGPREVRMRRADRFGVAGAALEPDDLDVRVAREEADELCPDVARGPDDADPDPLVQGAGAAVRRNSRLDAACAHGRTWPLAGGRAGAGRKTWRIAVMA